MMKISILLLATLTSECLGNTILVGKSAAASKTINIPDDITSCHVYPANECCGNMFEHKLTKGKLQITRVDYASGWEQELKWECMTDGGVMHLPVEFRFFSQGVNCHNLYDAAKFWTMSPRATRWTTQVNMRQMCQITNSCDGRDIPVIFKTFFGNLAHGNNWVTTWRTYLRIVNKGTYTFVKQIGYAETAIAYMNGVEMFRSRCREPLVVTELELEAGLYEIKILQQDDGWEDSLMFMYNGPDSDDKLVIIPSSAFMKPCAANEFSDVNQNYKCVQRSTCKSNTIASTFPDEDCVDCQEDGVHRCVDGEHAPLTTTLDGSWFSRTKVGTTMAPAKDPTAGCDGCGYRIRACAPPLNNTWDVDFIQFVNKDVGVDSSFKTIFSSGFDHGQDSNHDYHHTSYAPEQAFSRGFNLWRGKKSPDDEWFIGMMSDQPMAITGVDFMTGSCGDRSYKWWQARSPRIHNITKCIDFQKWDGSKWATLARTTNVNPCQMTLLQSKGPPLKCPCVAVEDGGSLGDGVCQSKCDTLICAYDQGDCRTCPGSTDIGGLADINNGKYTMLNKSDIDKSTVGNMAQIECDDGYQLDHKKGDTAICNATDPKDWQSATEWAWASKIPSCVPIFCTYPDLDNHLIITSTHTDDNILVTQTVKFACDSNHFELDGKVSVKCEQDGSTGKFKSELPTCVQLQCDADALAPPDNGVIHVVDDNSGGNGITFGCEDGYTLSGAETVTCSQETWSDPAPTCEAKTCPAFTVNNGQVTSTPTAFPESVTVTCDTGFRQAGANPTCSLSSDTQSVEWDVVVTCEPITCELCQENCIEITTPNIDPTLDTTATVVGFNDVVTYSCPGAEYVMEGDSVRTCTEQGFDVDPPMCRKVQCEYIEKENFLTPVPLTGDTDTRYSDEQVTITCPKGFQIGEVRRDLQQKTFVDGYSSVTLTCKPDGWDQDITTLQCTPRGCIAPQPQIALGTLFSPLAAYSVGDEAFYDCDYTASKQLYVCSTSQVWSQRFYQGQMDGCATPEPTTSVPTSQPTPSPTDTPSQTTTATTTPTTTADGPSLVDTDASTADALVMSPTAVSIIAVVVIIVLVVIVAAAVYINRLTKAKNAEAGVKAFENPMYDGTNPDENAYEDPDASATTGYTDVPAATGGGGGGGYMDVSAADGAFDADDDDEDI